MLPRGIGSCSPAVKVLYAYLSGWRGFRFSPKLKSPDDTRRSSAAAEGAGEGTIAQVRRGLLPEAWCGRLTADDDAAGFLPGWMTFADFHHIAEGESYQQH